MSQDANNCTAPIFICLLHSSGLVNRIEMLRRADRLSRYINKPITILWPLSPWIRTAPIDLFKLKNPNLSVKCIEETERDAYISQIFQNSVQNCTLEEVKNNREELYINMYAPIDPTMPKLDLLDSIEINKTIIDKAQSFFRTKMEGTEITGIHGRFETMANALHWNTSWDYFFNQIRSTGRYFIASNSPLFKSKLVHKFPTTRFFFSAAHPKTSQKRIQSGFLGYARRTY